MNLIQSDLGLPHVLGSISLITLKGVYSVPNTFLYLCVYLIFIGLEIKLRYNELRCIDGSLYRGPIVFLLAN